MLRQVLTLLAVITGLAATGQVAQARVAAIDSVALESASFAATECSETRPAPIVMLTQQARQRTERKPCKPTRPTAPAPTVMLGPDRARE